ncbi:phosphotransferase [Novosphingobium hassiacum]|uniref:phosphotransferase n=1 Tax=Novosphingobium hassiacum TaxID=173676 RepID=UPI0031B5DA5C
MQVFGLEGAARILARHYGLSGTLTALTAERDENFRVQTRQGQFVLKVFAPDTPADEADMLCAVLNHLEEHAPDLPVPRLALPVEAGTFVRLSGVGHSGEGTGERLAVLYSFLPGTPLMDVGRSTVQAQACGVLAARLGLALRDFTHPAMHRRLIWDLRRVSDLAPIVASLREVPFADFVVPFIARFADDIAPTLDALPRQFIHNDLNARNVIVASKNTDRIAGIIDFGDSIHTARVCDLAIGMVGQMAGPSTAQAMMQAFLGGGERIVQLSLDEREILPHLVAARIVQNVVMTAHHRARISKSRHFLGFNENYFGWRVAFVQELVRSAA